MTYRGVFMMSDTLWRKLFRAFDGSDLPVRQARLKLFDIEGVHVIRTPGRADFRRSGRYIETAELGPIAFRTIEWLEVPVFGGTKQDLVRIERLLARVAVFPMMHTDDTLRIVGHVR